MRLCRMILILAVLTIAYVIAVLTYKLPGLLILFGFAALVRTAQKKGVGLNAFGTARWADKSDLERAGMLSGSGMSVGRIHVPRQSVISAVKGLFDSRISDSEACERFALATRKLQHVDNTAKVRLSKAVHIAVFAPTGVGKGITCVIPHLLNCPDSMVVVDFKGENALITAEHRAKEFGHKIVILDPFGVVTQ